MTDDLAKRTVKECLKVDDDYGDMSLEMMLVKAGYRAGLGEAKKHYDDLKAEDWSYKSSWEIHGDWLDTKLKEQI